MRVEIRRVWTHYREDGKTLKYATVIVRRPGTVKEYVLRTFDPWLASLCELREKDGTVDLVWTADGKLVDFNPTQTPAPEAA